MERDLEGGSDVGRDLERDLGDEPRAGHPRRGARLPGAHRRFRAGQRSRARARGIDLGRPRPRSTTGRTRAASSIRPSGRSARWASPSTRIDRETLAAHASQSHSQPLLDEGPAGLPVVYTIDAGAFDIVVNGDHLLSWGVEPAELQDAAMQNLAAWSATAPWTDEVSGDRRLISSDTGAGWDAVRVLLPEVLAHLVEELGGSGRILVGVPERHLLTAGSLRPGDDDFATLFAEFIVEHSGGADEPIDRRVFELVDGRLVEFAGL